jgi:hypothetical protein
MENALPDLTPTHTELQTLRTHTSTATVEALLDASFEGAYHRCVCGAMIVAREAWCYPCSQGNRARGPIYGASLAGHPPVPGDALRAVEAVWLTPAAQPCPDCAAVADRSEALAARVDDLLEQNDALCSQIVALKAHEIELCAQVRQGKAGT